jgi:hypothetical protein
MEPAFNLAAPYGVASGHPLDLRYRLLVHKGAPSVSELTAAWERFAATTTLAVRKRAGEAIASLVRAPGRG